MNDATINHNSLHFRPWLIGTVVGAMTLISVEATFAQSSKPTLPLPDVDAPAETVAPPQEGILIEKTSRATNVPEEVLKTLNEMDEAANQRKLKSLLRFYHEDFTHSDGLTRQSMKRVIKAFWTDHQELNYKTDVLAWEADKKGGGVATTKTTITGKRTVVDQEMKLMATIHSQQRWLDKQMVEQTITAEQSQMTSGVRPPEVTVNLPEQVKVGEKFNFDVIVGEPLDDRLLLGTAIEEVISAERYLMQPKVKLELLPAGGLFKVGEAPKKPTSEWISAVLVQDGGMIMISRRLTVVRNKPKTDQSLLLTP